VVEAFAASAGPANERRILAAVLAWQVLHWVRSAGVMRPWKPWRASMRAERSLWQARQRAGVAALRGS
jgi:hypothetical protein